MEAESGTRAVAVRTKAHPPRLRTRTAWRRIVAARCAELGRDDADDFEDDIESVHRRRVAIRRLRSALALFAPCLDRAERLHFDAALRELGRAYGPARDWDVACLRSFPAAMAGEDAAAAATMLATSDAARRDAHERLAASGAEAGRHRLAQEIARWAAGPSVIAPSAANRPVDALAPELLRRLDRRVRRRGRRIGTLSDDALHALRKAMKRASYAAEALEGVAPGLALGAFRAAAGAVLDQLGRFNDAGVARGLAEGLASDDVPVAAPVRRWAKRRARKAKRRLEPAWRDYRAASRPWD